MDDSRPATAPRNETISLWASLPFAIIHLMPLGAIWTGVALSDVILCIALYYGRMFFVTSGYHRYFAHKAFKTSRVGQFLFAVGAMSSLQKGVLWWSGHHRHHHRYSDMPEDIHSPKRGFWWSHVGWILCPKYNETPINLIQDFGKYPELRWLNRHHWVPGIALGALVFFLGGASALFIGFFLSTALLYHGTFTVNSLAHVFGRRRFATTDTSRNSMLIALITMGEGWHNNHHHYQASVRQGFKWWEIDMSWYLLKMLSWVGVVWDLKPVPERALKRNLIGADGEPEVAASPKKTEPEEDDLLVEVAA